VRARCRGLERFARRRRGLVVIVVRLAIRCRLLGLLLRRRCWVEFIVVRVRSEQSIDLLVLVCRHGPRWDQVLGLHCQDAPRWRTPGQPGGGGSSGVQRIRPIGVLSAGSSRCTALAYELSTSISATETPLVGKCPESGRAPPSFCRRSNRLLSARDFVDSHDCAFSRPWRRAAELLIPTPEGPAWPQRRRRLPRRKMSA